MKVELLKNIANCCEKDTSKAIAYPTLINGELWATNGVVAVRYTEDVWKGLASPDVPWQIRDEEYKGLKPGDMLLYNEGGFYFTNIKGDLLPGKEALGVAAPEKYPDFPNIWGGLLPHAETVGEQGRIDPKQLRKVIGVFQTAHIFPYVESTEKGLRMWGTRYFAGFKPSVEAIVYGMRLQ